MKNTDLIAGYDLERMQKDYLIPALNLKIVYFKGGQIWSESGIEDNIYTRIINADTGDTIITVKSDILKTSSWTDWERYLTENDVSVHSPVYRVVKSVFDEEIFVEKDAEDSYDEVYEFYIAGYYI